MTAPSFGGPDSSVSPKEFRYGITGTGPGPYAPDGSPVDVFANSREDGEAALIASYCPPGGSILELGCGAGRVTNPLHAAGYRVTAVDESRLMLDHVNSGRRIHSRIEDLDLGPRFDLVVLPSYLIHVQDMQARDSFLRVCSSHIAEHGAILINWHPDAVGRQLALADGPDIDGTERTTGTPWVVTVGYVHGGRSWSQRIPYRYYTQAEMTRLLDTAGIRLRGHCPAVRDWMVCDCVRGVQSGHSPPIQDGG